MKRRRCRAGSARASRQRLEPRYRSFFGAGLQAVWGGAERRDAGYGKERALIIIEMMIILIIMIIIIKIIVIIIELNNK